jgi:hypothetical protein
VVQELRVPRVTPEIDGRRVDSIDEPASELVLGTQHREMWKDFLDLAYWNVELDE